MEDLKSLCIDNNCMDVPQGGGGQTYAAGANIDITNDEISVKSSPSFTGTPKSVTNSTASDSSTQIATDAFVQNAIERRLPKTTIYEGDTNISIPDQTNTAPSTTKWTAPAAGVLIAYGSAFWAANATGLRLVSVRKNGTSIGTTSTNAASVGQTRMSSTSITRVATGDVIDVDVYQSSGAALNLTNIALRGYFIPD